MSFFLLRLIMPLVKLPQLNRSFEAPAGANLMQFLLDQQIPVASSCLGDGICSKCRVRVVPGNISIGTASEIEKNTLKRNKCADDERLSCQITINSDLEVFTSYW